MKRLLALTILLTSMLALTACAAATESPMPTLSPSATSTASHTPSPTATASPTKTPTPTATLPDEQLEGSTYREIARINLKGGLGQSVLSPDGRLLAILSNDGVYLYDPNTLEVQRHFEKEFRSSRIAWTVDNDLLVISNRPSNYLLDPEDGNILGGVSLDINAGFVIPSPTGKYITTLNSRDDYSIFYSDPDKPGLLLNLPVDSLIWMPDGEHVISFPEEGPIEIWNVERGKIVQELESQLRHLEVRSRGFSTDQRYLAYSAFLYDQQRDEGSEREVVWDLSTGEQLTVEVLDGSPSDHGWQLDEQTFAINGGLVVRINGSVAELTRLPDHGSTYQRPDGLVIVLDDAILQYDKGFNLINTVEGHRTHSHSNHPLSPDGQMLAIGSSTRFYVWDIEQDELITAYAEPGGFYGAWAAWSPSGKTLAIGSYLKGQIHFWDRKTQTLQNTINTDHYICEMEWIDESSLAVIATDRQPRRDLVVCPESELLLVFDAEQQEPVYQSREPLNLFNLQRSPDGKRLAYFERSSYDVEQMIYQFAIWDTYHHQTIKTFDKWSFGPPQWLPGSSDEIGFFTIEDLLILNIETGEERSVMLPEENNEYLFDSFYLIGGYLLQYGHDNNRIKWYDLDGNLLATDQKGFNEFAVGDSIPHPIVTEDGRMLNVVDASAGEILSVALIELFPPEQ